MLEKPKAEYYRGVMELLTVEYGRQEGKFTSKEYVDTINRIVGEIGAGPVIGLLSQSVIGGIRQVAHLTDDSVESMLRLMALGAATMVDVEQNSPQIENES